MALEGAACGESKMSNRMALGWMLLLNLAALLVSLALGILFGAYDPEPSQPFATGSVTGNVSRLWLTYFATLLAFVFSWWILTRLTGARLAPVASVALAFLLSLLCGVFIGLAWGIGAPIGYVMYGSPISIRTPLILLMLVWGIYGIVFTFFWVLSGAYLGLVAWLIAWIARGRFRHNAK